LRPKGAIELVIFDCDGVLIDTEPVANVVLQQQLEAAGLAMPYDEVMRTFVGRSKADCLTIAAQRLGRPLPADHFRTVLRWRVVHGLEGSAGGLAVNSSDRG